MTESWTHDIGQIEILQRSSAVLSFVDAREALGSETARVHHAHRRRGGRVAACGALSGELICDALRQGGLRERPPRFGKLEWTEDGNVQFDERWTTAGSSQFAIAKRN